MQRAVDDLLAADSLMADSLVTDSLVADSRSAATDSAVGCAGDDVVAAVVLRMLTEIASSDALRHMRTVFRELGWRVPGELLQELTAMVAQHNAMSEEPEVRAVCAHAGATPRTLARLVNAAILKVRAKDELALRIALGLQRLGDHVARAERLHAVRFNNPARDASRGAVNAASAASDASDRRDIGTGDEAVVSQLLAHRAAGTLTAGVISQLAENSLVHEMLAGSSADPVAMVATVNAYLDAALASQSTAERALRTAAANAAAGAAAP